MSGPLNVLDLGNVLLRVDWQGFVRGACRALPEADPALLLRWCTSPEKLELDRGWLAPLAFLERLGRRVGVADPRLAALELLEPWTDIFTVLPGGPEAVARLAAQGELWLLSDTDPAHMARALNDHPFLRGFDRYLLSYARGCVKTDVGAFEPLLAELRAGRSVRFFDDRPDIIAAARAAGVDAVLFEGWPTPGR